MFVQAVINRLSKRCRSRVLWCEGGPLAGGAAGLEDTPGTVPSLPPWHVFTAATGKDCASATWRALIVRNRRQGGASRHACCSSLNSFNRQIKLVSAQGQRRVVEVELARGRFVSRTRELSAKRSLPEEETGSGRLLSTFSQPSSIPG